MTRKPKHSEMARDGMEAAELGYPVFAQPQPTPDPTKFLVRHHPHHALEKKGKGFFL